MKLYGSGPCDNSVTQIFDTKIIGYDLTTNAYSEGTADQNGKTVGNVRFWKRCTDSEFKMLNKLALDLKAERGKVYDTVTGSVLIVSERKFCPSCTDVISQFKTMFPKVDCTLIDNVSARTKDSD